MSQSKTSPSKLKAEKRRGQALQLRMTGMNFFEIAEQVGVSQSSAHRYVTTALAEITKQTLDRADQLRALENARLDAMLYAAWPAAQSGDLGAINTVLKAIALRARLNGLEVEPESAVSAMGPPVVTVRIDNTTGRALPAPESKLAQESRE